MSVAWLPQDVFERGIDAAPGGRRKAVLAASAQQHHVTLADLARRQTQQPGNFDAVMELARRSTMGGGRGERGISLQGSRLELPQNESSTGSARQSVVGESTLKHARERLTHMGQSCPRRTTHQHHHGGRGSVLGGALEDEPAELTPEQLEARLEALLQACTYTVFSYTQRGLFDRDKLTFTSLLTTQILLKVRWWRGTGVWAPSCLCAAPWHMCIACQGGCCWRPLDLPPASCRCRRCCCCVPCRTAPSTARSWSTYAAGRAPPRRRP